MKCLILAAGRGSRLSNKGQPKPLVPFLGLTLIERAILTANACGINEFFVVTGYQGQKVREFLDTLSQKNRFFLSHIINEQWDLENGVSVLKAKHVLTEPFLLMMCDHVVSSDTVRGLLQLVVKNDQVFLAVDYDLKGHPKEVISEATKVKADHGKILDIGKKIPSYNGLDCGVFLCGPVIFQAIEKSMDQGDSTLSGAIRIMAKQGQAYGMDVGKAFWYDIDDENSYARAERGILSTLKKPTDGPVAKYINRPISIRITRRIINKAISPNTISLLCFFVSVVGGLLMAFKDYLWLLLGAVLAQFSSIIDGCDGEIARLRFETSEFGGWLDSVLDRYSDAAIITGLTFHSLYGGKPLLTCAIGFFALAGTLINSYTADKYDGFLGKKLKGRAALFRLGRDIRIFIVFLGGILNQVFWTLLVIGILMNLENLRRILLLRVAHSHDSLR